MTTYCLRAKSIVNKNHWVSTLQEQIVASYGFDQNVSVVVVVVVGSVVPSSTYIRSYYNK